MRADACGSLPVLKSSELRKNFPMLIGGDCGIDS